ncbi:MAG: DUF4363 family protein [Clostridia bacterium]|nr:DUF4363 family protein [Clostridia bacterium]
MSRLYTSITIVILIAAICVSEIFMVKNTMSDIYDVKNHISSVEEIAQSCDEMSAKWEKRKPWLNVFVDHNYVDQISQQIAVVLTLSKSEIDQMWYAEYNRLVVMAKSLDESETINIENFF